VCVCAHVRWHRFEDLFAAVEMVRARDRDRESRECVCARACMCVRARVREDVAAPANMVGEAKEKPFIWCVKATTRS